VTDVLLIGLVVVAALVCPLHMWWMSRRGKSAACCPPPSDDAPTDVASLRARRREIEARLEEFEVEHEIEAARTEPTSARS
jgi:hypothetical protein